MILTKIDLRRRPRSWARWFLNRSKRYGYSDHIQTFDRTVKVDFNELDMRGQGLWLSEGNGRRVR